jgi:signal transduction histidine kinase
MSEKHHTPRRRRRARTRTVAGPQADASLQPGASSAARPGRDPRPHPRSKAQTLQVGQFAPAVLDALTAHICVLDKAGWILAVNEAWRRFARENPPRGERDYVGDNYLRVCDQANGEGCPEAGPLAAGLRRVLNCRSAEFSLEYPCHAPGDFRWFVARVSRVRDAGRARAVVAHENITQRERAEQALRTSREQLRALAGRLQVAREEERSRVAREIHDVLAQELTRLNLDLNWLRGHLLKPDRTASVKELDARLREMSQTVDSAIDCVQRIATELRPVVLDSLGLSAAVEWQARDFHARNGIECSTTLRALELVPSRDTATAAFRILQESLTNVSRHAGATRVDILLEQSGADLVLRVRDNGRGIPPDAASDPRSVGLAGMRERALLLGGQFEVRGRPGLGTTVEVHLPLPPPN